MNTNNREPFIFVGVPSYDGTVAIEMADRLLRSCRGPNSKYNVHVSQSCSSILAQAFNCLWCEALNMRDAGIATHFAMLHADIVPEMFWLDKLLSELRRTGADVVSAVVPIKNIMGLTSTAIGNPEDWWHIIKRLTMTEVHQYPETFSAEDAGYPGFPLLVNTGCWITDLSLPWCNDLCFNLHTRNVRHQGQWKCEASRSEDWDMSRFIHARGGKCLATKAVKVDHIGAIKFGNYGVWGTHNTDPLGKPMPVASVSVTPADSVPAIAI